MNLFGNKYGLSNTMGPKLRKEVERQLLTDLQVYIPEADQIIFDWSESCVEGKSANWLDGSMDRFSGIRLFDFENRLLGEGWMDFVLDRSTSSFIVYWRYLELKFQDKSIDVDSGKTIPNHIEKKIIL